MARVSRVTLKRNGEFDINVEKWRNYIHFTVLLIRKICRLRSQQLFKIYCSL